MGIVYTLTQNDINNFNSRDIVVKINNIVAAQNMNLSAGDIINVVSKFPSSYFFAHRPDGKSGQIILKGSDIDGRQYLKITPDRSAVDDIIKAPATGGLYTGFSISGTLKGDSYSLAYKLTQDDINNLNVKGVELYNNNVLLTVNSELRYGDVITAKAKTGWQFVDAPIFKLSATGDITLTLSGNNEASATIKTQDGSNTQFTITQLIFNTKTTVITPDYTFKQADIDKLISSHVTMTAKGLPVTVGMGISYGDSLVAVASGNYEFYSVDSNPAHVSISFTYIGDVAYFAVTPDNKKATLTFTRVGAGTNPNLYIFNCATKQGSRARGTGGVFKIDKTILAQINNKRFVDVGDGSTQDYGDFILSVLELPFKIDPSLLLNEESVMLGTLNTNVKATKVNTDLIPLDLGNIVIPNNYNNLLDYANTKAILHLPRVAPINIDLEYVIGQTIGISYNIDCYSGSATINITSTKINDVIITKQVDLGIDIPFINAVTGKTVNNSNIDLGGDNGVLIPYIEIVRNDAILPKGLFTVPVVDESLISGQSGFIKIDNVELETSALGNEKAQIISLLNSGVIIK